MLEALSILTAAVICFRLQDFPRSHSPSLSEIADKKGQCKSILMLWFTFEQALIWGIQENFHMYSREKEFSSIASSISFIGYHLKSCIIDWLMDLQMLVLVFVMPFFIKWQRSRPKSSVASWSWSNTILFWSSLQLEIEVSWWYGWVSLASSVGWVLVSGRRFTNLTSTT